jgi:hypothetical protein
MPKILSDWLKPALYARLQLSGLAGNPHSFFMTRTRLALFYIWYVIRWTAIITAGGALVGAVVFPIIGLIAKMPGDPTVHLLAGIKNLGFLTFVWAPGISIVLAFEHAYKRHRWRLNKSP